MGIAPIFHTPRAADIGSYGNVQLPPSFGSFMHILSATTPVVCSTLQPNHFYASAEVRHSSPHIRLLHIDVCI